MDAGATISVLDRAAKEEAKSLRLAKRKLALVQKQAEKDRQAIVLWLRMLWLLGSGNSHLMKCAWRVRKDDMESIWNPSEVTSEKIGNIIGREFLEEALSDADPWSFTQPKSTQDIVSWRRAWEFCCEWQLACAVAQVNLTTTMGASPEWIHSEHNQIVNEAHPCLPAVVKDALQAVLAKRQTPAALRQWLCRWRRRWGSNIERFPTDL